MIFPAAVAAGGRRRATNPDLVKTWFELFRVPAAGASLFPRVALGRL